MRFKPGRFQSRIIMPLMPYFWARMGRVQNYCFRPNQFHFQRHRQQKAFQ